MNNKYLNIYNNLIKLTRNKNLYLNLDKKETFSDRLIFLLFHFAFFLKANKKIVNKKELQKCFDFIVRQLELSIREIGYGDVTVNKKMKNYINILYSIIDKISEWENLENKKKSEIFIDYLELTKNLEFYLEYFEKYSLFLRNNTFKNLSKDIINFKF
tara:strand:- start:167 stop:640 length:474 start_codon:yes stop_codon:yes gene_type:complete